MANIYKNTGTIIDISGGGTIDTTSFVTYSDKPVEMDGHSAIQGYLSEVGGWVNAGSHLSLPIDEGCYVSIQASETMHTNYAFLKDLETSGASSTIDNKRYTIESNQSNSFVIPKGTKYLYIQAKTSTGVAMLPKDIVLAGLHTELVLALKGAYKRELNAKKYDGQILNFDYLASYSLPNTMTAIKDSFSRGFKGMKADMRTTKDNGIILCHDDGYTFDANGRITTFNKDNNTKISSLNLSEIESLEFATLKTDGTREHPCTLERFLRFCKANSVIPYITARYDDIKVAELSYRLLQKYDMQYNAIYNIYPLRSGIASALNKVDDTLLLCDTIDGTTTAITMSLLETAIQYKCKYICFWNNTQVSQLTEEMRDFLSENGLRLMSLTTDNVPMKPLIENGVVGFQNYLHRTEIETLEF